MSGLALLVGLVPLPPLVAALLAALLAALPGPTRRAAGVLATAAVGLSLVLALGLLASVAAGQTAAPGFTWGTLAGRPLEVGLLADPLSASMAVLVGGVGVVVFAYATAYLRGEPGYGRFFAQLSLFLGGMLLLVLSGSLLLLYLAWELVGVTSYLLIGFYRDRPEAAPAASKAFLVTRLGDLGLLVGILLLYLRTGDLSIAGVNAAAAAGQIETGFLTLVALLLLLGAMGKSAQVPLHVWLPDAMAGPTPVSALIHSATMVAAGVFLVARLFPVFEAAGPALTVVATVGALTALLGAAAAAAQHDLKRVLAYSTISQLGEMLAALGAGAPAAGLFHLVSQALFKACLFLAAGSLGHVLGSTDLAGMGGLRRAMPRTFLAFVLGAWALAALPPFAGFWSGDAVLGALWRAYPPLFFVVLAAVGLAGFYATRAGLLAFGGHRRSTGEVHESPPALWGPALLLGLLAAVGGLLGPPLGRLLGAEPEPFAPGIMLAALAASLAGVAAAATRYAGVVANPAWRLQPAPGIASWARAGFGFDRAYGATFGRGAVLAATGLARFERAAVDRLGMSAAGAAGRLSATLRAFDVRVLDRAANGLAHATLRAARGGMGWDVARLDRAVGAFALGWGQAAGRLARTQTGRVYHYLLAIVLWGALALALLLGAARAG